MNIQDHQHPWLIDNCISHNLKKILRDLSYHFFQNNCQGSYDVKMNYFPGVCEEA